MKIITFLFLISLSATSFAQKDVTYIKDADAFFIVKSRPIIFSFSKAKKKDIASYSKTPHRLPQTYKEVFKSEK